MAPTKAATTATPKPAKRTTANATASKGFSAEEKAAARERVRELKAEAAKADGKQSSSRLSPGCRNRIAPLPRRSTR